jgi:hypothetical protein
LGTAILFSYLAVDLYEAGPSGWIWGFDVSSETECAHEFTLGVALSMHQFYIALVGWDLARTLVDKFRTAVVGVDHDLVSMTAAAKPSSPYWFWYLVLYFTPYEDAAIPVLAICCTRVLEVMLSPFGFASVLAPQSHLIFL